mgnify:CR=1 FL=1
MRSARVAAPGPGVLATGPVTPTALLASIPPLTAERIDHLQAVGGAPPDPAAWPAGCSVRRAEDDGLGRRRRVGGPSERGGRNEPAMVNTMAAATASSTPDMADIVADGVAPTRDPAGRWLRSPAQVAARSPARVVAQVFLPGPEAVVDRAARAGARPGAVGVEAEGDRLVERDQ